MIYLLAVMLQAPFVTQRVASLIAKSNHEDLLVLTDMTETGKVIPAVDHQFHLDEIPAVMRYFMEGHSKNKVVLSIP